MDAKATTVGAKDVATLVLFALVSVGGLDARVYLMVAAASEAVPARRPQASERHNRMVPVSANRLAPVP